LQGVNGKNHIKYSQLAQCLEVKVEQVEQIYHYLLIWILKCIWLIFIGHGGAKVAEYVKENLFSHLLRHPKFMSETKVAIGIALFFFANKPLEHSCVNTTNRIAAWYSYLQTILIKVPTVTFWNLTVLRTSVGQLHQLLYLSAIVSLSQMLETPGLSYAGEEMVISS
jgi:hypothetical protein